MSVPVLADLPFVGDLLAGLNWFVYLAPALVIAVAVFLRTRRGRHLLAVGEAPAAAAAAGIKVGPTQTWALVAAGAIAGLGGAFLSVGDLGLFTRNMSGDRGWLGITAALLALNRPALVVPAAAVFGFASSASIRLQQFDIPPNVTQFIPQGAAFIALVLIGLRSRNRGAFAGLWARSSRIPLRLRPWRTTSAAPSPPTITERPSDLPSPSDP